MNLDDQSLNHQPLFNGTDSSSSSGSIHKLEPDEDQQTQSKFVTTNRKKKRRKVDTATNTCRLPLRRNRGHVENPIPPALDVPTGNIPDAAVVGSRQGKLQRNAIPVMAATEVDNVVAKQLSALSINDREQVYADIHGVPEEVVERPDVLKSAFKAMDASLANLEQGVSRAYHMAKVMDTRYVKDEGFRLAFLRADRLNPQEAALRYARHFQAKLDLFGEAKLTQDITQDDLDEPTTRALHSGYWQYLPLPDRSGRLVRVSFNLEEGLTVEAKLRVTFYTSMVHSESEESQRKGGVAILYLNEPRNTNPCQSGWQLAKLLQALPVRMEAIHLCHPNSCSQSTPVFTAFKNGSSLFTRLRIRDHHGTQTQVMSHLQTYGLPVKECFPLSDDGQVQTQQHIEFLEKRRKLERLRSQQCPSAGRLIHSTLSRAVGVPWCNDVLLGRGKRFYRHSGNTRFRQLIETMAYRYNNAPSSAMKRQVAQEVISKVHESLGKFLREDDVGWIEVDNEVARHKVSHVFRTLR